MRCAQGDGGAPVEINWDLDPAELEAEAKAQQESLAQGGAGGPALTVRLLPMSVLRTAGRRSWRLRARRQPHPLTEGGSGPCGEQIDWDIDMSAVELSADGVGAAADPAADASAGDWKIEVAAGGASASAASGPAASASVRRSAPRARPPLASPKPTSPQFAEAPRPAPRRAAPHAALPQQSVLSKPAFRARLVNELLELRAFLAQRRAELRSSPGAVCARPRAPRLSYSSPPILASPLTRPAPHPMISAPIRRAPSASPPRPRRSSASPRTPSADSSAPWRRRSPCRPPAGPRTSCSSSPPAGARPRTHGHPHAAPTAP